MFGLFFVFIYHEFGYVIARIVVDGVRDIAELACAHTFVGHSDEKPSLGFNHAQIVNNKAIVDSYDAAALNLPGSFTRRSLTSVISTILLRK